MAKHQTFRIPRRLVSVLLGMLTSLSGCAQDYSLAPPANSDQVTVRIKVPPELEVEKMEVMYRSTTCQRTRYDAYGEAYKVDGFHGIDVQPQQQGQSDIYEAKLDRDGGGACRWHLANVTFGVAYKEPAHFGKDVKYGAGGGVVVIFDNNDSPRGGADVEVDGDLSLKESYYPWVDEGFLGGYKKRVSLVGPGKIYLIFKAPQARLVYFEPILYSNFVVYSAGPKIKMKGSNTVFTYPDGSKDSDGRSTPDIRRLDRIRLAAESKK